MIALAHTLHITPRVAVNPRALGVAKFKQLLVVSYQVQKTKRKMSLPVRGINSATKPLHVSPVASSPTSPHSLSQQIRTWETSERRFNNELYMRCCAIVLLGPSFFRAVPARSKIGIAGDGTRHMRTVTVTFIAGFHGANPGVACTVSGRGW